MLSTVKQVGMVVIILAVAAPIGALLDLLGVDLTDYGAWFVGAGMALLLFAVGLAVSGLREKPYINPEFDPGFQEGGDDGTGSVVQG